MVVVGVCHEDTGEGGFLIGHGVLDLVDFPCRIDEHRLETARVDHEVAEVFQRLAAYVQHDDARNHLRAPRGSRPARHSADSPERRSSCLPAAADGAWLPTCGTGRGLTQRLFILTNTSPLSLRIRMLNIITPAR